MKVIEMKSPLNGIIPPMITPLRGRDELDLAGLERLIEHLLAGGVCGLFILGTIGEGPSLSYPLRRELINQICRHVNKRVPILVGITDTSFVESVRVAGFAADAGAYAVVLAPPYYPPEAQSELQEYLDQLLPELPLPVFLQNVPALTKIPFDLVTIRRATNNKRIIGLNDSSGDMAYFRGAAELIRRRRDWTLFIEPEEKLLEALQLGGNGGVSGGANLFPKLYVKLVEAYRAGDLARAKELQAQIQRVGGSLYQVGKHSPSIIKGVKCALACLGICDDFMAEPLHRFRAGERDLVQARLRQIEADLLKLNL
jgi:dihydrodipicolinate synthase/N-acetylneuraminate lyase